jgi:hypothetical protein
MWASVTFGAIAIAGLVFMVRFLVAMLHERVQLSRHTTLEPKLKFRDFSSVFVSGNAEEEDSDGYIESLERKIYEEDSSDLITLAVFPDLGGTGWRPRTSKRVGIYEQRRFFN